MDTNSKASNHSPNNASGTMNAVSPASSRVREPEAEPDAKRRQQAKDSIAANDKGADAKRDVIDRMNAGEVRLFSAAGSNRLQADQVLRGAAAREERESVQTRYVSAMPPLEDRFNLKRKLLTREYEFRDQPGKLAFAERFDTLRTNSNAPAAAMAMMDRAGERGWDTVRVEGSEEFKRLAWVAAAARNIKAVGYEPTRGDIDTSLRERGRLHKEAATRIRDLSSDLHPSTAPRDFARELADQVSKAAAVNRHPNEMHTVRAIQQRAEMFEKARTSTTVDPAVVRQLVDVDARDFRSLRSLPRHEDAAVQMAETAWASPEYKAALSARAPEVVERVQRLDAAITEQAIAKDERKRAEFASMQADRATRDANAREQSAERTSQAQRNDPERLREDRAALAAVTKFEGALDVMRGLEKYLDQHSASPENRIDARATLARDLVALHASGMQARLRIYDIQAARSTPQTLPKFERQRTVVERAR